MARLNIEDQFFLEIGTIARKFGNDDEAIGNAIRFFRYAQEKHKLGLFVPEEDFAALGFSEALFPLFAKRTDQGIECAGAKKYFGWLAQKIEAGRNGGKASAKSRFEQTGSAIPINAKNTEATPKRDQAKASDTEPSPSPSPSPSKINTNTAAVSAKPARKRLVKVEIGSVEEMRNLFDEETRKVWHDLYPDPDYRQRESLKCWDYYRDAGRKRPTTSPGWKRVLSSWLERGWAKHAAGIPNPSATVSRFPAPYAPKAIRYGDAEDVYAPEHRALTEEERQAKAQELRDQLAKVGNLGKKASA